MKGADDLEAMFAIACAHLDDGRLRDAFRLFRQAAMLGHQASELNLGYCFDVGAGVRRSRADALFWYRKAASRGDASAANNIGTLYRDEGRPRLAERWLQRAVSLGSRGSLLDLGKLYLGPLEDPRKAKSVLSRLLRSRDVTEDSRLQAKELLRSLKDSRPVRR